MNGASRGPARRAGDAERDRADEPDGGQRPQRAARDGGAQRPAVQLVEAVRGDADREGEGRQRRRPAGRRRGRARRRADRDVGEVPGRVRRVQERHVVAPAAGRERVERGRDRLGGAQPARAAPDHDPAAEAHPALPARRRSPRARTPRPARRRIASGTGMLGRRNRPTSCQAGRDQAARRAAGRRRCRGATPAQPGARRHAEVEVADRRAGPRTRASSAASRARRRRSAAGRWR